MDMEKVLDIRYVTKDKNETSILEAANKEGYLDPTEELENINSEYNDSWEKIMLEKDDLVKQNNFSRSLENIKMLETLNTSIGIAKRAKDFKTLEKLSVIKRQLISIDLLSPLQNKKLRPAKASGTKKEQRRIRDNRYKLATRKLSSSKKYTFLVPGKAFMSLKLRLPDGRKHYAELFFDILNEFIITNSLKSWAIFIAQTLNNLYKLRHNDYDFEYLQKVIDLLESNHGAKQKIKVND